MTRRRLLGEFLGTGVMVGVGCGSIAAGAPSAMVCLAFGAVVTAMILVFGPWSGAHINPAVSIAFWLDDQLEGRMVAPYIVAQSLGGMVAAWLVNGAGPTLPASGVGLTPWIAIEMAITCLLMMSILLVVDRTERRSVVAVVVGGAVAVLAWVAGPATGASMNPARTLGPNLVAGEIGVVPVYVVATTLGAALACWINARWCRPAKVQP